MSKRKFQHVFGPVPSRRLGRSLGVDLVPFKVCPFDCVYCQLGRTTVKTDRRKAYVPADEVLEEIRAKLADTACDCITLSGSGEPTLHRDIGRIIAAVKSMTDIPVAVITNGALLSSARVRRSLLRADVVMPDLDAGDEETFRKINRPCKGITLRVVADGLKAFRREYRGRLDLEVFLVAGVNDSDEQIGRTKAIIDELGPDSIDLNTVARPPAEKGVRAVSRRRLERIRRMLGPKARIVASRPERGGSAAVTRDDILDMVRRRPCTLADLAAGLRGRRGKTAALAAELVDARQLAEVRQDGDAYYVVPPPVRRRRGGCGYPPRNNAPV